MFIFSNVRGEESRVFSTKLFTAVLFLGGLFTCLRIFSFFSYLHIFYHLKENLMNSHSLFCKNYNSFAKGAGTRFSRNKVCMQGYMNN